MPAVTPESVFDEIEPEMYAIQERIQDSGLSLEDQRRVVTLVCADVLGMGVAVTDEIEGILRDDPGADAARSFADHVVKAIQENRC